MKTTKILTAIAIVGIVFTSCKKESANTSSSLGVKIQATNSTFSVLKSALTSDSVTAPGFVWDTCYLNVSEFEFQAEKREAEESTDSTETHYHWNGPKMIDLLGINSLIGQIDLQPGIFEEIEIEIQATKAAAGTSPVFYLSGNYTDASGVEIPVIVIVDQDITIKVKQEGSVINSTNDYSALINVSLASLMNGISQSDIGAATITDGKVIINNSSNTSLYSRILENFSTSEEVEYHED